MADIAMLVAEEYERRVRNSRKSGGDGEEEINFFVGFYGLARGAGKSFSWIKETVGVENLEMMKKALEPKTQIAHAASHGLFSA